MWNLFNFQKLRTGKLLTTSLLSATCIGLLSTGSVAETTGSIAPSNNTIEDGVGEMITINSTVTVNLDELVETTVGAPEKIDILFLADNTGSMGGAIANVQTNAQSLLNQLAATYSDSDIQFGVARYYGAPKEYASGNSSVPGDVCECGDVIDTNTFEDTLTKTWKLRKTVYWSGDYWYKYKITTKDSSGNKLSTEWKWTTDGDLHNHSESWIEEITENVYASVPVEMFSYELQEAMGASNTDALGAIDDWHASGGKDWPEANFFALHQAATSGAPTELGWATGHNTNWRDDAMKIIVWFGDAPSHTSDTTEAETITALTDNDVYVVAIDVAAIDTDNQASNITAATGGAYASSSSSNVASTMETLIGTAVASYESTTIPTVNLDFKSVGDTTGLDITYTCTDPDGCTDVPNGAIRTFQMTVTGTAAKLYEFETRAYDADSSVDVTGAIAENDINLIVID